MQAQILTFIIPAIALIFSAIFAALWWQNRQKLYVLAYSYCFGSMAMGVALNLWFLGGYGSLGLVTYHVLSMSGLIALMWGTSNRVGQRIPLIAYSITVAVTCVILWYAMAEGQAQAGKLAQNTNSALLFALAAQNLWHAPARNWGDRALVWVLAVFASFGFVRPLLTYLSQSLFGAGEQGASLLTSLHAVLLALLLTLMAMCLVASIISDNLRKQVEESTIDPLSGLRMRGAFEEMAAALGAKAASQQLPVSLIVADIDHFKRINDTLGHSTGDAIIKSFGGMLANKIRPKDVAGRVGGEEFCVMVWNCDVEDAKGLAERIRLATMQLNAREGERDVPVSASFGVAAFERHLSYSEAFARADKALYDAKNSGRNRVRVWNEGAAGSTDSKAKSDHHNPRDNVVSLAG